MTVWLLSLTTHPPAGESTPLFMAAGLSKGSEKMVQLLLASRASVSARTNTGETPLHAALAEDVRFDFPDGTVRLLLEHGACLSATNRLGETPLHTAAENAWGHETVVRLLLNRGADVSANTKRGETPLHFAAHAGNQEVTPPLQ